MNADVREEIAFMKRLGWTQDGKPKTHIKMRHPKWGQIAVPCSPSDYRWRANHRAELARSMGTTLTALLKEMGVRPPKSQKRRRGRPKRKRVVPETELHDRRVGALHRIIDKLIDTRLERLEKVNSLSGPSSAQSVQREIHALERKKQELDWNPPSDPIDPRVVRRAERVLNR